MDFIFNHPGQTFDNVATDLDQVVNWYSPTELDTYNTIYVPYRPLHKLILRGAVPQPANMLELLKMKEFLYDYLITNGYHNTVAETYSKHKHKSQYQTAHCGRQNIVGIGVGALGTFDTNMAVNPPTIKNWMRNVDEHGGISMESFQDVKFK